ncbi:zinc ribbon domain-containing protein [Streptomyces rhizosphaericus]|uniref:Recombinase zinc beta ribbon domain-containing protein n=1 Tax=Streptomyces rhizosphaericus TaxID=114699 RepID=A0A6G4AUS7_9ACTN|nr:hypothetical protein [Streptomyces rhizosphaericus]
MKWTRNPYLLRGAIVCAACKRRMQGHRAHEQAYYRCRSADQYALATRIHHPRNACLLES